MDKNAIKKYAVWARRELISRVSQKALQYGITDKSIVEATADSINGKVLSASEKRQRQALISQIRAKSYEQVMEEVAYTWFNRFSALRFMEVNGYLPSRVRVFTDDTNAFKPQIIAEAIQLELDGLDMEKVYAFKDANDDEGLFKYLLIVQCNALSKILPGMFQRIEDYTELLLPDNLLREGSVIEQMVSMIPEEDWKDQVQIIGWLYQYYNAEKKDEVFAALKKNVKITKENIPAATQLFTPDWIVRYMVENSLGRLWLEGHPNEDLKGNWRYYLEEAEQEPEVQEKLAEIRKEYAGITPEQIKCIDPCSGSGHILAYLFDVLVQIYEAYGYTTREAVASIVENNIYGLDIDDRAAQLAYFSVMMKARQYDRRFLTRKDEDGNPAIPQPHVYAICESNGISTDTVEAFANGNPKLLSDIQTLIREMHDAKEYGSILNITPVDFAALYQRFDEMQDEVSLFSGAAIEALLPLVQVADTMAQKYDVVVTNPPYMSSSGMSTKLNDFVKDAYPDTKSDMSTVFMEKTVRMCHKNRFMSMINIPVWMFLSSYEKLRNHFIYEDTFINMVHPGRGIFGSDFGTTSFVVRKGCLQNYLGNYRRLFDIQGEVESIEEREKAFLANKGCHYAKQASFLNIPGAPIAYWVSDRFVANFTNGQRFDSFGEPKSGVMTGDDGKFVRFWFEPSHSKIGFNLRDGSELADCGYKWFPITRGGAYRKWYGNLEYVVDLENDGYGIKNNGKNYRLRDKKYYFKQGLTWSMITSYKLSVRLAQEGILFGNGGPTTFSDTHPFYLLALLNSKVSEAVVGVLNPTLNTVISDICSIPVIFKDIEKIETLAIRCLELSKADWDSFETSWDFQQHPFVRWSRELWDATAIGATMHYYYGSHPKVSCPMELCYMLWQGECNERFKQLKENEEELNRIFIDIYGLQDELAPEVEDKDVTVRRADLSRDIRSFISYAVGCIFGRYSLDVPGLVYAGGEWDESKYTTFLADKDNILPICDDDYFKDDIVGLFVKFVERVYGKDSLEDNLRFIADALGGKGAPRDTIRSYFLNDFYTESCSRYSGTPGKRPIYWLFDSGKKNGFKALVYMHRYQPDTIARMRTDYVHEQQARYRTAIADLEQRIASVSTSERVKLSKRLKTLQEQAAEIQGYEEKIHHLADQYISIDLDDGVKVNYAKFQDVLAKIK